MKRLKLLLFILICSTACTAQAPDVTPPAESRPTISALAPLLDESSTAVPPTPDLTLQTFLWVMDLNEQTHEFSLIKLRDDGQELWRRPFEPAFGLGLDPQDDSLWTIQKTAQDFATWLTNIDGDGQIINQIEADASANIFALDLNDGGVWINLVNENEIVKLNAEGTMIARAAVSSHPYAMVVNPYDSAIWLAEGDSRKLIKFNQNGERLVTLDTPGFFSDSPQQIAVDPRDGSIWHGGVEDVFKLSADGAALKQIRGFEGPVALAVDPQDGSVWVADFHSVNSGDIVKLDQNGGELFRLSLDAWPRTLAVHPEDGSLWVGIRGALLKLSADGFILTTVPTVHLPTAVALTTVMTTRPPSPSPTTVMGQTLLPMPMTPTPTSVALNSSEVCQSIDLIVPGDCESLVQLLYQIDPNLLQTLENEGCLWRRLFCNQDGQLTELDLASHDLDMLPPEIGDLENLQILRLSENNLTSLPPEIGNLTELQTLDLHGNNLSTLPIEIGQLSNLQALSVNYNPLNTLPAEIGQLASLQSLDLWAVNLNSLPPEIGSLTNLQHFSVSGELEALPPEIGDLTSLIVLNVFSNNLTTIPPEIGNLGNLSRLELVSNELSSLPPEIGNLINLRQLDLSHNKLETLPREIGNLVNLEVLLLAYNSLDTLPSEVSNLSNLQEFCLYYDLSLTLPPQVEALKEKTVCTMYAN